MQPCIYLSCGNRRVKHCDSFRTLICLFELPDSTNHVSLGAGLSVWLTNGCSRSRLENAHYIVTVFSDTREAQMTHFVAEALKSERKPEMRAWSAGDALLFVRLARAVFHCAACWCYYDVLRWTALIWDCYFALQDTFIFCSHQIIKKKHRHGNDGLASGFYFVWNPF